MPSRPTLRELAKMIDHSLLHPTMTDDDLRAGCEVALHYDVATACVKPYFVAEAAGVLAGSDVGVCAVAGFPHGTSTTATKVHEAAEMVGLGATEVDVPVNTGKVLGGDWAYVTDEIRALNEAVTDGGALLKVIFETDFLDEEHVIRLCEICSEHSVAFVKTSTGYGMTKQETGHYDYEGATDPILILMRKHSAAGVQVKGAGKLRTLDDLLRVRNLGVTRIGATATETILEEARQRGFA